MKKLLIIVVTISALIAACNPYGSKVPANLVGNYLDIHNGEWKYGLYEEFAIYQKDFWDYESVADNQIVLSKKTGEKVALQFAPVVGNGRLMIYNGVVENLEVVSINGDTVLYYQPFEHYELSSYYALMSDGIKKDTADFKKHRYGIDTAVVRIYIRNTAKGISALGKRELNRNHSIQVFNYLEAKDACSSPIDSTDHYGYRYEIKIPVTGVSEMPMRNLFTDGGGYNSSAGGAVNYVVEPCDTLMFFYSEDHNGGGIVSRVDMYRAEILCAGDNQRFNTEKNLSFVGQIYNEHHYISEHHYYDENNKLQKVERIDTVYEDMCPLFDLQLRNMQSRVEEMSHPVSDKFVNNYARKLNALKRQEMMNFDKYKDTLKTIFPIDEDEIFSTITAYNFVINYIAQNADTLPSTPENLAQHPDWIVAENDGGDVAKLLDPAFIKSLGLSDDFIEFYRLMHAVQFYDDFSPVTGLKDFELQSVMKNLTRDDYKRYLEEKMKR